MGLENRASTSKMQQAERLGKPRYNGKSKILQSFLTIYNWNNGLDPDIHVKLLGDR